MFRNIALIFLALWLHLTSAAACTPPDARHLSQHLAAVNAVRSDSGLGALTLSDPLTREAQAHACDMAKRGYFSHTSPDGGTMEDRLRRARLTGMCRGAENIARGQADINAVMHSWMGSTGHRRNLLDNRLSQVGFGLGPGNIWVQLFAGPCR